jgi:beta-1,4-mannosyl-glycoprotein beta-1,4-N-acetylglucosaminyltransferase
MNISAICACKNRREPLNVSLSSWLNVKEIKEIIIVDWSSDESIEDLVSLDDRIKIIRVDDEKYFNLPQPLNLAASIATGDYILKLDTDYIFNPYYNFLNDYPVDEKTFVTGKNGKKSNEYYSEEWGTYIFNKLTMSDQELDEYFRAYSPFFRHLSGFLLVSKENFDKVGGYNEDLGKYYGYEDDEFYSRLELLGLTQKKITFDYKLLHIPHQDTKRFENYNGFDQEELESFKSGLRMNRPNQTEEEIHWEAEYCVTLDQSKKSKALIDDISNFYVSKKYFWNIEDGGNNVFYASKELKVNNSKLNSIPSIYCMNLAESTDRRRNIVNQFNKYGHSVNFLTSKRFSESNDIVTGKYAYQLNDGTKGCCVSHLKAIKEWYEKTDHKYGFFCEDDLSLETVEYWNFTWEELINDLPEDWECVQLLSVKGDLGEIKLRDRYWDDWAVSAYIITRDYAKRLIETYCLGDTFNLEVPNQDVMPLIENILFASVGKTYTYPLFVEDIRFTSTFDGYDDDVKDGQKNNHYKSHEYVLDWWKNNQNKKKEDKKTMTRGFVVKAQFPPKKKSNVVDCFLYFNEKELLELRINLLKDHVDKFIIVEGNYTFSGIKKEYTCKDTIKELGLPENKIEVIELDLSEEKIGPPTDYDLYFNPNIKTQSREKLQRNAFSQVLNKYDDNTVFIISDCDEIINPQNIDFLSNILRTNREGIIKIPLVLLEGRSNLRTHFSDGSIKPYARSMVMCLKQHLEICSPDSMRSEYQCPFIIGHPVQGDVFLNDLGWHFSWMGSTQDRVVKSKSFSYTNQIFSFSGENKNFEEFINSFVAKEGSSSLTGDKDNILKSYPLDNLPQIIFDLPRVKNYLLPEKDINFINIIEPNDCSDPLSQYALNTEDAICNWNLAHWYEGRGHHAPALSYFLRCAERTDDKVLAYEALIHASNSYDRQGTRDGTAKGILQQALCLVPERPEAYFLLSRFCERRQCWQECYIMADQALNNVDFDCKPLKTDVEYPGKYGLLFEKAISSWWWGKTEESKKLFLEIKNNYEISEEYAKRIEDNLSKF